MSGLIITNAKVFTADAENPAADAVVVQGKKVAFVGTEADALAYKIPGSRVIDAGGKTLMPGIIDSHFHLYWGALNLANVALGDVRGVSNLRQKVQAFKDEHPDKTFLRGGGLAYDVLPNGERLTRQHVDKIEADIPLILVAFDFHSAWCNTAALRAAGILHGAEVGSNAEIVMAGDGTATGELREFEAMQRVTDLMPAPSKAEERTLLEGAVRLAHSYGITSVHNMNGNRDEFALYQEMDEAGELGLRVYFPYRMYPDEPLSAVKDEAVYLRDAYKHDRLKAGALKMFMDGVIESFTGFMLDPYVNQPSTRGSAIFGAEQFNEICVEADALGLQIAVHAIGDAAIRRTLDGYAAARRANGKRDSRHRIEHIEFLHPDDLPRFAELDVVASMQPYHCTRPEDDYLTPYLQCIPEARYGDCFPWQSLRNSGAHLCFGSDWPVVSMNPFVGFHAAVTREPWRAGLPNESQALADTLLAYTRGAAYVEFAEQKKGQLKAGMLADMVLLSEDVFSVDAAGLAGLKADLTVLDGEVVFG